MHVPNIMITETRQISGEKNNNGDLSNASIYVTLISFNEIN